ncbi:YdcF family protein [Burkholderia sp. THE68]|uniref:YdcF family protein n=1 Tax=Burkholderia sp. THE68 TaxID=758782 RepID=UPI001E63B1D0|nr:YdcF family protein [Burkholderia sp. THE68]
MAFVVLGIAWKRRRIAVMLVAGVVFWLLGSWLPGPLVRLANHGHASMIEPTLGARTAIIVLGGGTWYDRQRRLVPKGDSGTRVELAAALYKRCVETERVCFVIMSGGNPQHHEQSEADLYGGLLVDAGVKRADLILENQSLDTYENARNTEKILRSRQYDASVLITSSLHMRRALLAFDAFDLHPQPAVAFIRVPRTWWVPHRRGWFDADSALHELIGIARFYVWRWVGLY